MKGSRKHNLIKHKLKPSDTSAQTSCSCIVTVGSKSLAINANHDRRSHARQRHTCKCDTTCLPFYMTSSAQVELPNSGSNLAPPKRPLGPPGPLPRPGGPTPLLPGPLPPDIGPGKRGTPPMGPPPPGWGPLPIGPPLPPIIPPGGAHGAPSPRTEMRAAAIVSYNDSNHRFQPT